MDEGHVWSSSYGWLGNENRMITTCLVHPDARPLITYSWPSGVQLMEWETKHDKELNDGDDHHRVTDQRDQQDPELPDAQP